MSTSTEVSMTAPPVAMAMEPRTAFLDDSAALNDPNDLSAPVSPSQLPDLSQSILLPRPTGRCGSVSCRLVPAGSELAQE